jgi:hypothetical protein
VLSFLSVEIGAEAFQELHFRIENGELALVDEVFSDVASAVGFFNGALDLFDAAELPGGFSPLDLRIVLELESAGVGSGFAARFALGSVAIPEPSTGALLLVGLLAMVSTARVRARARPTSPAGARGPGGRARFGRSSGTRSPRSSNLRI